MRARTDVTVANCFIRAMRARAHFAAGSDVIILGRFQIAVDPSRPRDIFEITDRVTSRFVAFEYLVSRDERHTNVSFAGRRIDRLDRQ